MYSFYNSGSWSPATSISTLADVDNDVLCSYNPLTGQFIATWADINQNLYPFYSIYTDGVWSPINTITATFGVTGSVLKDRFLTQTDIIHKLVWTPPADSSSIVFYQITRNGTVIAVVPASGPLVYYDHNRSKRKTDVYTIVSVSANQTYSTSLSITL
jgi:hypothetical protein